MKKEVVVFKNVVRVKTKYNYISRFNGNDCVFYCFQDALDNSYIFNTSSPLEIADDELDRGDEVLITGNIKSVGEYDGKPQTKLVKVQVIERLHREDRWEEIKEKRRLQELKEAEWQRSSVTKYDKIERMSYKKYKNEYADCETVKQSYDEYSRTIEVIIRDFDLRK